MHFITVLMFVTKGKDEIGTEQSTAKASKYNATITSFLTTRFVKTNQSPWVNEHWPGSQERLYFEKQWQKSSFFLKSHAANCTMRISAPDK
jgi:hypothetical protein